MLIYSIRNKKNGKRYIGQTIQEGLTRFRQHLSELRNNKHNNEYLQMDFNRYKEKDFDFRIMKTAASIEDLNNLEIDYIKKYKCLHPNGYNKRPGGGNYILQFEQKVKLAILRGKGRFKVWDAETGQLIGSFDNTVTCAEELGIRPSHISSLLRKVNHSILGYVAAYEWEKKPPTGKELQILYSEITARGVAGNDFREFIAYNKFTGQEVGRFKSKAICEKELDLYEMGVSQALRGALKSVGDYVFAYSGDPIPPLADEIEKVRRIKQSRSLGLSPFFAYDCNTGDKVGLFHTGAEFSKYSGASSSQISKALNSKKWVSVKGHILIKKSDRRKPVLGENYANYKSNNNAKAKGQKRFYAYDLNTGYYHSTWDTQESCAKNLGLSRRSVGMCLSGKRNYANGYIFRYRKVKRLRVYGNDFLETIQKRARHEGSSRVRGDDRPICMFCSQTGKKVGEFLVISDIVREYGLVDISISKNLRRVDGYWQVNGYVFCYKGDPKPLYGERLEEAIAWSIGKKNKTIINAYDSYGDYYASYPNAKEASIDLGLSAALINRSIRKGVPYKGFLFERE